MSASLVERLDRIADRYAVQPETSQLSFALASPSTGFTWTYGDSDAYFIASVTKLYTTALVMQLRHEGAFTLETRVAELLGDETMRGLNVFRSRDHGPEITVRQLLAHTSGIPDYFEQPRADGSSVLDDMFRADLAWTFDDTITAARELPGRFAPSTRGKAFYSDTNYQLLGRIIEVATGADYEDALRHRILTPLGLEDTYLFTQDTEARFGEVATMLHGATRLRTPRAMGSFMADGGMVSTAQDGLRFLQAFMSGGLFPDDYLPEMTARWNRIFWPLQYGVGLMRFVLPRFFSPMDPVPAMIGHSGASGTVLFQVPEHDLYISGTVNQVKHRSLAYKIMLKLATGFGQTLNQKESARGKPRRSRR